VTRSAIGIVTIGQSPRADVVPDIVARLPPDTPLLERGALDDAGPGELARLAPGPGEEVLVSRLRDGAEVALAEARLLPLVQAAVDHVTGRGARVVAVLCTGSLSGLRCPRSLLQPGDLVRDLVTAMAAGRRLGVVVPDPGQTGPVRAGWAEVADSVLVLDASPYGPPADLRRAASTLAAFRPDLVILDCLGFDAPMRQVVAGAVGVPVILPRTVLADALAAHSGARAASRRARLLARVGGRR
jgi:protein AroM